MGYIEAWTPNTLMSDRRRTFYRLTDKGRQWLSEANYKAALAATRALNGRKMRALKDAFQQAEVVH